MTDRRYNDEEVSAIFAKSAEGPQVPQAPSLQAPRSDGLTLAELQDIGREVGIAPEAVAHAARALDVQPRAIARTVLGLPIGVERIIELDRRMTDAEWELLVVQLREVFHARGALSASGSFRQWTNGNLQALLEPTPTGHRLRLSTYKGNARASMFLGLGTLGVAAALFVASTLSGHLGGAVLEIGMFSALGVGLIANGALRVSGWARVRGRQFDAIAAVAASAPN
ncbi:MAG: hypothetical protein JWM41_916 [Gemmatimonadetes bacterium]|nr:hypothetical protein [Gemmatimonadota bacterium]